jgi:hypothetical protein
MSCECQGLVRVVKDSKTEVCALINSGLPDSHLIIPIQNLLEAVSAGNTPDTFENAIDTALPIIAAFRCARDKGFLYDDDIPQYPCKSPWKPAGAVPTAVSKVA